MKKIIILQAAFFLTAALSAETINFSADYMKGTAGSKTDSTTLEGNAFVKTDTMEIKADSIELSGDDFRFITAEGNVKGTNSESQLEFDCGRMKYDRKTKIARLEDSVHLVDTANNVTADAQIIEYNQDSETAVMQIAITLKQKDNTCTSAYAIYRKKAQMLEMSGNPKIVQGKDTFRAQEITLNLESQEITLDGRVRGTVTDSQKSEKKTEVKKNDSAPKEGDAPKDGEVIPDGETLPEADTPPAEAPEDAPSAPLEKEKGDSADE